MGQLQSSSQGGTTGGDQQQPPTNGHQHTAAMVAAEKEKLLRRNMRSALQQRHNQQQQEMVLTKQRKSRSKSLEPKAALDIRTLENRMGKSARFGPRTSAGGGTTTLSRTAAAGIAANSTGAAGARKSQLQLQPQKELWNPDRAAAQLIGQQLQNPHAAAQQPLLCCRPAAVGTGGGTNAAAGGHHQQQSTKLLLRKQSVQNNDLDLGADERNKDLTVTGLTMHQVFILQKIWERSPESEIVECSRNVFLHLLRSNAQMYQFFDLLGLSDREILTSPIFLRQSANFAIVLDFVLTNVLDQAQKVCLALQCLGAQHARLSWPVEPHHWALFSRCFEDNPPKEVFQNAEGHDLWKTIISFIVIQMRLGYDRASTQTVQSSAAYSAAALSLSSSPRLGGPSPHNRRSPVEAATVAAKQQIQSNPSPSPRPPRYNAGMRANTMAATADGNGEKDE